MCLLNYFLTVHDIHALRQIAERLRQADTVEVVDCAVGVAIRRGDGADACFFAVKVDEVAIHGRDALGNGEVSGGRFGELECCAVGCAVVEARFACAVKCELVVENGNTFLAVGIPLFCALAFHVVIAFVCGGDVFLQHCGIVVSARCAADKQCSLCRHLRALGVCFGLGDNAHMRSHGYGLAASTLRHYVRHVGYKRGVAVGQRADGKVGYLLVKLDFLVSISS